MNIERFLSIIPAFLEGDSDEMGACLSSKFQWKTNEIVSDLAGPRFSVGHEMEA